MSRFRAWVVDWSLALVLTGLAQVQLYADLNCCGAGQRAPAAFVLTMLETLPLGLRRRLPVPVLAVTGGAAIGQLVLRSPIMDFGSFGVLVAFFTVAASSDRRLATGLAVAALIGIPLVPMLEPGLHLHDLLTVYAEYTAAWVLGDNARYRRRHAADQAQRAATTERARIARELHDVVAHGLSLISIQAGAARSVLDADPDAARSSLRSIEAVSRESWTEMRRFLDGAAGGEHGLGHLAELIQGFESAGLAVDLVVRGQARPLPAQTDRCAYRVVQESLTNALRHAGAPTARVTIGYDPGSLQLEIANQCRRRGSRPGAGRRHGLMGMRERVELAGGQLLVEEGAGRFTVWARLPAHPAA